MPRGTAPCAVGWKHLSSAKAWTWSCRAALKGPRRLGVQPGTEDCLASVRPSPLFSLLGRSVPQSLVGLAIGFRVRRDILPLATVPSPLALPGPLMLSCREQKVKQLEAKWDQRSWPSCHSSHCLSCAAKSHLSQPSSCLDSETFWVSKPRSLAPSYLHKRLCTRFVAYWVGLWSNTENIHLPGDWRAHTYLVLATVKTCSRFYIWMQPWFIF